MELGDIVVTIKDCRGMHHLAILLRRPRTPTSAAALFEAASRSRMPFTVPWILERERGDGLPLTSPRCATESERVAVTRALRAAIKRIAQINIVLGNHLNQSIRTGQVCAYIPAAEAEIRWEIHVARGGDHGLSA